MSVYHTWKRNNGINIRDLFPIRGDIRTINKYITPHLSRYLRLCIFAYFYRLFIAYYQFLMRWDNVFHCIICPFYSLTISSYLLFNAKIIPVVLLIPHNKMHFTFERFDLRSMKIFTFDDDFNLLSLLYLGEVISTQWYC